MDKVPEEAKLTPEEIKSALKQWHPKHAATAEDIAKMMIESANSATEKAYPMGVNAGKKEIIAWLIDYAVHGGLTPLEQVTQDLKTHSPYNHLLKELEQEKE
jgi:hypothetical protein